VLNAKKVFWCQHCLHFFVDPFPKKAALEASYDGAVNSFEEKYFQSFHGLRTESYTRGLETLERLGSKGPLLDVGTGLGFFLTQAHNQGWKAEGLEVSPKTAAYAKEKFDLPIHVGNLEEVNLKTGHYQVVTLWDVLEHLPDPKAALRQVHTLLGASGIVVIRTPVCDSFIPWALDALYRISFGKIHFGFEKLFEEHLFHFSEAGLRNILSECGFRLLEVYREDYIDYRSLHQKAWAKNVFVRLGAFMAIMMSRLLHRQDEVVLYAQPIRT